MPSKRPKRRQYENAQPSNSRAERAAKRQALSSDTATQPSSPFTKVTSTLKTMANDWIVKNSIQFFEPIIRRTKSLSSLVSATSINEVASTKSETVSINGDSEAKKNEENVHLFSSNSDLSQDEDDATASNSKPKKVLNEATFTEINYEADLKEFYKTVYKAQKRKQKIETLDLDSRNALHRRYELMEIRTINRDKERQLYELKKQQWENEMH